MSLEQFQLNGELVVITGGGGFLGRQHAEAIAEIGGVPVVLEIDEKAASACVTAVQQQWSCRAMAYRVDITDEGQLRDIFAVIKDECHCIPYGLINNACVNPKFESVQQAAAKTRLEHFGVEQWRRELDVGLMGAFLCAKVFGAEMAKQKRGVIVNVSSDLGLIAPDQRIYQEEGKPKEEQPAKPVTYSVIKHGIIGLTKYLAAYWAAEGVRVNALAPAGIYQDQPDDFVARLSNLIPMQRMARHDEYRGAIQFLLSDASSYMTGATLVLDGGRSCW